MTLVNQTISQYKVLSLLGEGGMGEVYRARDTKLDGGALRQLTQSVEASSPRISPDGKWVVYQDHSNRGRRTMLWKVPIDGGTPMQLTETDSDWQVISPDGKLIAYTYSD